MPSEDELNIYYENGFPYSAGLHNEEIIRKRSRIILKKINQLAPYARSLCDVGSGYGFFIDEAKKQGYRSLGIEPCKTLVDYEKTHLHSQSFNGTLEEFVKKFGKQFDVVTCIHVIEHIPHVKKFTSLLFRLVKPGGIVYLETPNADSHLLYAEKNNYTFLTPPEHVWIFSQMGISALFPSNTEIVHSHTYSYPEHFMGILKALFFRSSLKTAETNAANNGTKKDATTREQLHNHWKRLSYCVFDKTLAPLFTHVLNLYHKGSILELYIKKK